MSDRMSADAIQCASLPVGWFLDTIGPQYSAITGAAVFAAGTLTFGVGYVGTCGFASDQRDNADGRDGHVHAVGVGPNR